MTKDDGKRKGAETASTEPAYMKIPGLGVLLLNVGGISALTSTWNLLPPESKGNYHAVLSGAFIAFGVGIAFSVISLCCQFIHDALSMAGTPDAPKSGNSASPQSNTGEKQWNYEKLVPCLLVSLCIALLMLFLAIFVPAAFVPWLIYISFGALAVAIVIIAIFALIFPTADQVRFVWWVMMFASGIGILFFALGLMVSLASWTAIRLADGAAATETNNSQTQSAGACAPPGSCPAPSAEPRIGGSNIHINVHFDRANGIVPAEPGTPPVVPEPGTEPEPKVSS